VCFIAALTPRLNLINYAHPPCCFDPGQPLTRSNIFFDTQFFLLWFCSSTNLLRQTRFLFCSFTVAPATFTYCVRYPQAICFHCIYPVLSRHPAPSKYYTGRLCSLRLATYARQNRLFFYKFASSACRRVDGDSARRPSTNTFTPSSYLLNVWSCAIPPLNGYSPPILPCRVFSPF
jgi:hypothetical protein